MNSNPDSNSFDVSSLFTSVPLDSTIDVILRHICGEKEIVTNIAPSELKELLLLCTKNVHFSFNGQFYLQKDVSACHSWHFMVEFERSLLPMLSSYMTSWKCYVWHYCLHQNRCYRPCFIYSKLAPQGHFVHLQARN